MEHSESASSRWARIIHEQQAGGFSIASFCRRRKLSQASFYAWRSRLRLSEAGGPAFVEVKVKASVAGSALELLLPGGSRVLLHHGFDRQLLREVLSVLEDRS